MWQFAFFVVLVIAVVLAFLYFRLMAKLSSLTKSAEQVLVSAEKTVELSAEKAYTAVRDELKKLL